MLHSGCVKLHQKFLDFVGLPMGLLREESPKNRMNTGLFGSRSGEYGLKAARRAPQFSKRNPYLQNIQKPGSFGFPAFVVIPGSILLYRLILSEGNLFHGKRKGWV